MLIIVILSAHQNESFKKCIVRSKILVLTSKVCLSECIVNEGIRAILSLFIFFLQEDFTRTKSTKSTKTTKSIKSTKTYKKHKKPKNYKKHKKRKKYKKQKKPQNYKMHKKHKKQKKHKTQNKRLSSS